MDATDIQTHNTPRRYHPRNKDTPHPKLQNKAKQAHTGHTLIATSYPQAALVFASLTFGSWGRRGEFQNRAV